jgi:hypothetical protein
VFSEKVMLLESCECLLCVIMVLVFDEPEPSRDFALTIEIIIMILRSWLHANVGVFDSTITLKQVLEIRACDFGGKVAYMQT